MSPKKLNQMLGPMGVIVREQQLQLPASLGMDDSVIAELLAKKSQGKKKIERHRFAEKPENPRALHNKKLYDDFQNELSSGVS